MIRVLNKRMVRLCNPAISLYSYTVSLVQWVNPLLPVMRDPGSIPMYLSETGILLLALSRYKSNYYIGEEGVWKEVPFRFFT
jgi:hypothetical protein